MSDQSAYPCPQCQIGLLQPKPMPYVRVVNGMFVSVPDMPTYTCDLCGYQEFGHEALLVLETLVGRVNSETHAHRSAPRVAPVETGPAQTLKP